MPNRQRFQPMPETANDIALDSALRPFIERFVREDKRARAVSQFLPKKPAVDWTSLIPLIDEHRGRIYTDAELAPWNAVRGVFLVGKDAYSVSTETAMGLYVKDEALFVSYGATFAVVEFEPGKRLLLT